MAHIQIRDLSFSYPGGKESLKHIDLTVQKGEYVVLCGKSGSGKTTLLRHLKTVLTPHGNRTGQVLVEGQPLDQMPARELVATI